MAAFAFSPLDPRGARVRLLLSLLVGAAAWGLAGRCELGAISRGLVGWDIASICLLSVSGWIVLRADADETRRRAAAEDPGRRFVYGVVVLASMVSVTAAMGIVHGSSGALPLVLSTATVTLSWLLTHMSFTLRYAHLYYRGGPDDEGGLDFPGKEPPDDLDFAYFAFTIGMCFQTSDVSVSDRQVRRTVLAHSLLSFAYNTLIVAMVLNLVIGKL